MRLKKTDQVVAVALTFAEIEGETSATEADAESE
jgi:hypothetical protein